MGDGVGVAAFFVTFVISLLVLLAFKHMAPSLGLIDCPGGNSAHHKPTVVGAGFAVAVAMTASVYVGGYFGVNGLPNVDTLAWTGMVLSLVGLADDRWQLSSALRLLIYLAASVVSVLCLVAGLTWLAIALLALAMTWLINLYNFMDGLDGFAVTQALSTIVGLGFLAGFGPWQASVVVWLCALLALALLPVLFFNWPPASVFMGDAGAVFVGFWLAVIGLLSATVDPRLAAAWAIFMMPFLFDATLTLVIRLFQGYPPHIGHRDHIYQRLADSTGSAVTVDVGLLVMHGFWLFPLACLAVFGSYSPLFAVIFSTIPSAVLLVYTRRAA